jgi:DNA-binding Lrp family transcriptional regulator
VAIAYVLINSDLGSDETIISEAKDILSGQSEIQYEIQGVYGVFDVVLKLISEDASNLRSVITNKIRRIHQVQSTLTMMVIDEQEKS